MTSYRGVLISVMLMFGCGGSDGGSVDSSEKLTDVTQSQAVALCNQLKSDDPSKTATCDGQTITVGDNSDCGSAQAGTFPSSCTATVGDLEDCLNAFYNDPCGSDGSADEAACAPLNGCGSGF